MVNHIYQYDHWDRAARGRELQFCATDAEVKEWLQALLLPAYAPYWLVGQDQVKQGKTYNAVGFFHAIDEFPSMRLEDRRTRWNYWICSEAITPGWRDLLTGPVRANCSVSGLILLQHPLQLQGGRDVSRIGICDRIVDRVSGEIRTHGEYQKLFNALKRRIKEKLLHTAIYSFRDGSTTETKEAVFTAEAARAYREGTLPLVVAPGRAVRESKAAG